MHAKFLILAQTPPGLHNAPAVIAACRAGSIGVLNGELEPDSQRLTAEMAHVAAHVRSPFGVRVDVIDEMLSESLRRFAAKGLGWLVVDPALLSSCRPLLADLRERGVRVLVQITSAETSVDAASDLVDGVVLKGHEAAGFVGEDSTFVLLQKWIGRAKVPIFVHGGVTPQVAAACSAVGVAGGVLDSQLLLLDDFHAPKAYHALFSKLAGSETVAVGNGEHGEYFRVLVRPGHDAARAFASEGEGKRKDELRSLVAGKLDWDQPRRGLLPLGQDVCFAAPWSRQFRSLAGLFRAIDAAVEDSLRIAVEKKPVFAGAPLARALNIRLPIVQGPMTRVSDRAEFADMVSEAGALPMLALALLRGAALKELLAETAKVLGERSWGVGLLGFAPQDLLDEQLAAALEVSPAYAIIAGGRPDQAVHLEKAGIPSFLHVPAAALIGPFIRGGSRRFIFEGRECGGHVGPLSSFVLWSSMVATLCDELDKASGIRPSEIQVLFAGGIHDAVSSAMVQVLAAPLVAKGVNVGILMGSAYLFTQQIVQSGAIVPQFQHEVLACERTVTLASGPGHASRCAYTPFAEEFFRTRERLDREGLPADEGRKVLDDLILGRLRIASKGLERGGDGGGLETLDEARQHERGMYMLGQVATLRSEITNVDKLHAEVSEGAAALLENSLRERDEAIASEATAAADVAIIGMGSLFPGANSIEEYWHNILNNVDAITEIPAHRWDWRLYFHADRNAKDKIYSKWGGFLDDLVFDPMQYGIPPRSVTAVDPMQLIALEVAQRTLKDAGYADRSFDHERTSVIIGSSGGTGDVGTQYCLRSELPRYVGELPAAVAAQLPEWTEDSFAGILANVIAGRVANRLNFGGVNFTTDAACASSLASVYQAVNELTSGRSDLVIAGGVDTVQGPFGYLCFSKTQALSPRGRCSSFSSVSDGIVISEGVAMIALKRLADAQRDGDRIYAVIKGVGGSSDGNAKGLTAPVPAGQLRAMRRAYAAAGFGPETVGLFEAHGTGTVAGDIAELKSTSQLIRESDGRPHQAVVGSVKTTIGHTKSTAGLAGLVKVALALHRKVLPPHAGVDDPNPVLHRDTCPLHLIDQPRPWLAKTAQPRRGAVSAFGFGGTNFHVVLEEHNDEYRPWLQPSTVQAWPAELLLWSAADTEGLVASLSRLQAAMTGDKDIVLRDVAAALAERFVAGPETLAIVARNPNELAATLTATLACLRGEADRLPRGVVRGSNPAGSERGKVAVLFSGQGSQYPEMLRELMLHFPVCADTLAKADEFLGARFEERFGEGHTLSHFVFPRARYGAEAKSAAALALTSTDVAQPALGAVDAAAFDLLRSLGLQPDLFAGHSFGEFVALYAGGAIDFESMLSLAAERGRAIVDACKASGVELGTMAAVLAPRAQVEAAIVGIEGVVIANHNAPEQIVLSGSKDAIAEATRRLAEQGARTSELPVAAGFHSPQVRPAQEALSIAIAATSWSAASIPVYSNTTAEPHAADVETIKQVMADHLVRPVEFVRQIEAMYRDGARIFVELGPKAVLGGLVGRILEGRPHVAVSIDRTPGLEGLLGVLAQLATAGVDLEIDKLFANRATPLVDPYELPAAKVAPKHAWLLNGSGARPVGAPPKQVGLTLEQARTLPGATAAVTAAPASVQPTPLPTQPVVPVAPAAPPAPPPPTPPVAQMRPVPTNTSIRERPPTVASLPHASPMTPRSKVPPMTDHDQAALNGYFHMMRTFLETQERVMSMVLRASPGVQPERSRLPPERVLPAAIAPPAMPAPASEAAMALPPQVAVAAGPVNGHTRPPAAPVTNGKNGGVHAQAMPVAPPAPAASDTAPPPPSPGTAAAAPASPAGAMLDRAALTELLLRVVEDKTGYPRDMVSLTQNLESDLGIDSIKRVEVATAMLEFLPEAHRAVLTAKLGQLNTQPTLEGMLGILVHAQNGSPVPFDVAEAGVVAEIGHPPRYVMVASAQPLELAATRSLRKGRFILTDDALGVADELSQRLVAQGCTVARVPRETSFDEAALSRWMGEVKGELAGIVHLASIGAEPVDPDASVDAWRRELMLHEKSLFLLLRGLSRQLADDGHVLAATGLGGSFGRRSSRGRERFQLQGGAVGLLKSHFEERPSLRVKAVDVDPSLSVAIVAANLLDELSLVGGRHEVGYPGGCRTAFHTVPTQVESSERFVPGKARVILATGGGRGVTAELVRELAAPGNTLVLTGRRPLEVEPAATASAKTAAELRAAFIEQIRSGATFMTPAEIGRRVQAILAARELQLNIDDFRRRGATVEYHAVDVTDEQSLRALFVDVQARFGAVTGIVHGAGIIEDKLVVDKTSESWSRVVETKVLGLLLLQKLVQPEHLEFLAVMSSVAGRYGNSGQGDYATANELMNRLCCQLRDRWPETVNVMALCWGPWGPTDFGQGMVSAGVEAKFAEKGVRLVSAACGRRLFADELRRADREPIEIICGEGPWETHEAELGAIACSQASAVAVDAVADVRKGALLGNAGVEVLPRGERILSVRLDANHAYLAAHRIDGIAILPAAAAVELFAEAGAALWPGWKVVEVRDCRVLKGVDLEHAERTLQLEVALPAYGSSEGFDVDAFLRSAGGAGQPPRTHYRCVLHFAQEFPDSFEVDSRVHAERQLSVEKAYGEWLFHGPCFQVIEHLDGLSRAGGQAQVRASSPMQWLAQSQQDERWLFDPALLDAGPQMAILWARSFLDQTVLPTCFGRVVRYREVLPAHMRMVFECIASSNPQQVRANVYYLDAENHVVLMVEDLQGIASSALNRLAQRPSSESHLPMGNA